MDNVFSNQDSAPHFDDEKSIGSAKTVSHQKPIRPESVLSAAPTEVDQCLDLDLIVQSHQSITGGLPDLSLHTSRQAHSLSIVPEKRNWEDPDGPDGGYGWFVVLGAFLTQFSTFGITNSWGIMQDYYERHMFDHVPNAQFLLTLAGTFMEMFTNAMGPLVQIIASRYGTKTVLILGTLFITASLELASLSNQIWHLYLTQGLLFGVGAGFMFMTAMGVTPQWFSRKRGFALGLASSGSGIGGLVFPFILTPLNNKLGIQWTYRIMGFVCLGIDLVSCIIVKEKKDRPKEQGVIKLRDIVNFSVLKDTNFIIWMIGSVFALMGYFIPFFLLPSYVTYLGMTSSDGSSIMAVMSASNFVGRIAVGFIGDRIGRLNANIIFIFISGLTALLVWMFAFSFGTIMAFSVLFGFFSPSYIALLSPITATILGMERFPTGLSLLLLSNVISVFGPTIASGVESSLDVEPYLTYKVFTGFVFILGGIILVVLKLKMTGSLFSKI